MTIRDIFFLGLQIKYFFVKDDTTTGEYHLDPTPAQ